MVALFVLATILTCVLVEVILGHARRRKEALAPKSVKPAVADTFLIPRGYFLSRGHSWAELLFTGNTRVGIDDFVQKLVGTVDGITVPTVNAEVRKGETLFSVQRGGRHLSFAAPLSGRVVEVNTALLGNPTLVNKDPYGSGWIAVVEPSRLATELAPFTIAESAARWLKKEISRFRDFIQTEAVLEERSGSPLPASVTLLDGGMPVAGVLGMTDLKTWESFQREFLVAQDD